MNNNTKKYWVDARYTKEKYGSAYDRWAIQCSYLSYAYELQNRESEVLQRDSWGVAGGYRPYREVEPVSDITLGYLEMSPRLVGYPIQPRHDTRQ